jgi:competence protein ComEA
MKLLMPTVFLSLFVLSSVTQSAPATPCNQTNVVTQTAPKINLNTADITMLSTSMKGIGKKRAEAIIKYRETHDGFKSLDELAYVPGLGKNFVSSNMEKLTELFTLK